MQTLAYLPATFGRARDLRLHERVGGVMARVGQDSAPMLCAPRHPRPTIDADD